MKLYVLPRFYNIEITDFLINYPLSKTYSLTTHSLTHTFVDSLIQFQTESFSVTHTVTDMLYSATLIYSFYDLIWVILLSDYQFWQSRFTFFNLSMQRMTWFQVYWFVALIPEA